MLLMLKMAYDLAVTLDASAVAIQNRIIQIVTIFVMAFIQQNLTLCKLLWRCSSGDSLGFVLGICSDFGLFCTLEVELFSNEGEYRFMPEESKGQTPTFRNPDMIMSGRIVRYHTFENKDEN